MLDFLKYPSNLQRPPLMPTPKLHRSIALLLILTPWFSGCLTYVFAQDSFAPDSAAFFESKIRPILESHCLECHSGPSPKGELSLADQAGWQSAGVIQPGDPQKSALIDAITSDDPESHMPPAPKPALKPSEIQALRAWIAAGAFDPRTDPNGLDPNNPSPLIGPKKRNRIFEITDADRAYWAFQPLAKPEIQPADLHRSPSDEIDRLLPSNDLPVAPPGERLRRLYLDLWGLPPSFEQVQAFEKDPSSERWNSIVEELLASHHYGERWGRYWLDWVRFAETNGYERDGLKPNAWRYRDYVIDALVQDKPYDQFIIEQLAGDQWAESQGYSPNHQPNAWREAIIATGFYRLHVWDDEPDDTLAAEFDDADDIMVTIGSAFLGLTIGCARCHDHKFDPVSQEDYYALLAFMRGIDPYGLSKTGGGGRGTGRIERILASPAQVDAWDSNRQNQIAELQKTLDQTLDANLRSELENQIKGLRDSLPPFEKALAVWEIGSEPKPTHVLHRGDPNSPKQQVASRPPEVFSHVEEESSSALDKSTPHRLQLARWIAHPQNPLTARVLVNRIWQRHFGIGIVPTTDDFGNTGLPPANPLLLDYLAGELIESGWSIKHLHRIILNTQAFSKSSRPAIDPDSPSYYQPQLHRLDAESIRDSILSVNGTLNDKSSGPSVYPTLSQEVKDAANPVSVSMWQESPKQLQNCRSVYLIVKRSLKVPFLETLDFANSTSPTAIRNVTTTAPQALLLLNDPWLHEQADQLAQRLIREVGSEPIQQIDLLWKLAYQRPASEQELHWASSYLQNNPQRLASLCRSVLNSNEFLYVD
jgi:mono/diheme cytochrome c family protein